MDSGRGWMAIEFARAEWVKRSEGNNVVRNSAYISRECFKFEGTKFQEERFWNYSLKADKPVSNEIFFPSHTDASLKNPEIFWNLAEKSENRKDGQPACHVVIALPDDKCVSVERKVELANEFSKRLFAEKGIGFQVVVHSPHNEDEFSEWSNNNWHAHVLVSPRKISEDGKSLDKIKLRHFIPRDLGKRWAQFQNEKFREWGLSLEVDPIKIVPEKHLGPVRLRGRAEDLIRGNENLKAKNALLSRDPEEVLRHITRQKSVFARQDFDSYVAKHVSLEHAPKLRFYFWNSPNLVQLQGKNGEGPLDRFSSWEVVEEEKRGMRLLERINSSGMPDLRKSLALAHAKGLTSEQRKAFSSVLSGKGVACIEGFAGTGKSYLLSALREAFSEGGVVVRGMGPDSASAEVLKEKGFDNAENVCRFVHNLRISQRDISQGNEVWIVDEAGKMGNRHFLELLKEADRYGARLILSGCTSQLPPASRGDFFRLAVERFGSQRLECIQRQRSEEQKAIAKLLASGRMAEAVDKASSSGSLYWEESKCGSVESLIRCWVEDRRNFPQNSQLILAFSNREMQALNVMAHMYRKETGEVSEKEYECETAFGKLLVSEGDQIEFRHNDRDLGVNNGTVGTLVKASPSRFEVFVKDGDKSRVVKFDPRAYGNFHLAYASTNFRSQGRTVDRAYILHSTGMRKEHFYVGFTRHRCVAKMFLSVQEVGSITQLKWQATRTSPRETTLEYLDPIALYDMEKSAARKERAATLKEARSPLGRFKGFMMETGEATTSSLVEFFRKFRDRARSDLFDSELVGNQKVSGSVRAVALKKTGGEGVEEIDPLEGKSEEEILSSAKKRTPVGEDSQERIQENLCLASKYRALSSQATALWKVFESSGSKEDQKKFWELCLERNRVAYELRTTMPLEKISRELSGMNLEKLNLHAEKHLSTLNRGREEAQKVETSLKGNIGELVYRLFPENRPRVSGGQIRIGSKGSLSIDVRSGKEGLWKDFSTDRGGGPIQLIQEVLNCDRKTAFSWARDFLGDAGKIHVPKYYGDIRSPSSSDDWISLRPNPDSPAPSLREVHPDMAKFKQEESRYPYRDREGNLLFYTIRLVDKESGKKVVLPLSYGKSKDGNPEWKLKGFRSEANPIYRLEHLSRDSSRGVLIVEGEKTADAAAKIFPDKDVISWFGGASKAEKVDWSPLCGRDVIFWPDNDRAGFEAAEKASTAIRRKDPSSLRVVDKNFLNGVVPPKWDLADEIPEKASKTFVKDVILCALERSVPLERIKGHFLPDIQVGKTDAIELRELLWRVEERLRPLLQKEGKSDLQISQEVIGEVSKILQEKDRILEGSIRGRRGGDSFAERVLREVMLFRSWHGVGPGMGEMEKIKESLRRGERDEHTTPAREEVLAAQKGLDTSPERTFRSPDR